MLRLVVVAMMLFLNACGASEAVRKKFPSGGISSGGQKPSDPDNDDQPVPGHTGEEPGDGGAPPVLDADCKSGFDLTGRSYVADAASLSLPKICSDSESAGDPACIGSLDFASESQVKATYLGAHAALKPVSLGYRQCGHDIYIASAHRTGVHEMHRYRISDDSAIITHLATGRRFVLRE